MLRNIENIASIFDNIPNANNYHLSSNRLAWCHGTPIVFASINEKLFSINNHRIKKTTVPFNKIKIDDTFVHFCYVLTPKNTTHKILHKCFIRFNASL